MKHSIRALALAAIALCAGSAFAAQAVADGQAVNAAEKERIAKLVADKVNLNVTSVETSPLPNFYTVIVDGSKVYYVEHDGKWLFDGHLVDMNTKTSVTAVKQAELEKTGLPTLDWHSLNLADAVKTVRGKAVPGRVLVTFEDPNCGYCKRLHPELDKLQNVTVYTFPVAFLGPDSQAKNEAMWCNKNRAAAWASYMTNQPVVSEGKCDMAGLVRNGQLAQHLMVRGTPTMFLADGSRIPGFMDAASIEQRLAGQQVAAK
jgi:thiol:disulfide interchange protein DsbC